MSSTRRGFLAAFLGGAAALATGGLATARRAFSTPRPSVPQIIARVEGRPLDEIPLPVEAISYPPGDVVGMTLRVRADDELVVGLHYANGQTYGGVVKGDAVRHGLYLTPQGYEVRPCIDVSDDDVERVAGAVIESLKQSFPIRDDVRLHL